MGTVTEKSQVTIPKHVRDVAGIRPGDDVEFEVADGTIILHKTEKPLALQKWKGYLGKMRTRDAMADIR